MTALHVIDDVDLDALEVAFTADQPPLPVREVRRSDRLDVAALIVEGTIPSWPVISGGTVDRRWWATGRSGDGSPQLTGVVSATRQEWTSARGHQVDVIQLRVDQTIGDYAGYSGTGVRPEGHTDAVFAVLVEQHLTANGNFDAVAASNVLFAIPIVDAMVDLELDHVITRRRDRPALPGSLIYHDQHLQSLRGCRSRLAKQNLAFVPPALDSSWHPSNLFERLKSSTEGGSILLTGHGGVGKTRTALEVGDLAAADGWDVIHVRSVNASRVADAIAELLHGPGAQPVLLILDYLNLARDIDLLSLVELAGSARSPLPRLSLLATTRSGWESRNRGTPGLDRFVRVPLARSDDDTASVCRAIVSQVAPRAVAQFGTSAVLDVTGSARPILAVLLGQIVEAQFESAGVLPAALVSEDLATWLDARLLEDGILPPVDIDGLEVPVQILIAAATLAAAPATADRVTAAVVRVVGGQPELVAVMVERLTRIGWLVPTENGLIPAHDVVVDKILESALFHRESEVARAATLDSLLDIVFAFPGGFTNLVTAVERVLDERAARETSSDSLRFAASRWLQRQSADLTDALIADPIASSRAAVQLLESELWNLRHEEIWPRFVHPLIEALGDNVLSAEPLQVAAKELPRGVRPSVVTSAIAWLDVHPDDEMVLNACLFRKDASAPEAERLIQLGLASLDGRYEAVTADFTLRRILKRGELDASSLNRVSDYARTWLAKHSETAYSVHLLSALIDREDLDSDLRAEAFQSGTRWVTARPGRVDGSLVLAAMIRHGATLGDLEGEVWPLLSGWLELHGTVEDANYVLQSIMSIEVLPPSRVSETWDAVRVWLDKNFDTSGASFLLKALLGWHDGGLAYGDDVWALVDAWLAKHRDAPEADFVIRASLEWEHATPAQARMIWPYARRWLLANGDRSEATYVLRSAIDWKLLPGAESAVVWQVASKWLTAMGPAFDATYVMQAVLRSALLDADRVAWFWTITRNWLTANDTRRESVFLYEAVIEWPGLGATQLEELEPHLARWWHVNQTDRSARRLLRALMKLPPRHPASRRVVLAYLDRWIKSDGHESVAGQVWIDFFQWSGVSDPDIASRLPAVAHWLGAYPQHRSVMPLLQRAMACQSISIESAQTLWPFIATVLDTLRGGATASYFLQELARWPHLPHFDTTLVELALARWLSTDEDGSGTYLIREIADSMGDDTLQRLWPEVASWLAMYESLPSSKLAIESLLAKRTRGRDEMWQAAVRWLSVNSALEASSYLIDAVLKSPSVTRPRLESVWPDVQRWFVTRGSEWNANKLLQSAIELDCLSVELATDVWGWASAWLSRHGDRPPGTFLLQSLLAWSILPVEARSILWRHVDGWLAVNGMQENASYLLLGACSSPHLGTSNVDTLRGRVREWLASNTTHRAAARVFLAFARSTAVSNRQFGALISESGDWLRTLGPRERLYKELSNGLRDGSVSNTRRRMVQAYLPSTLRRATPNQSHPGRRPTGSADARPSGGP